MNWYSQYKTANRREDAWLRGKVLQTDDGFVFVNVSNDIINGFFSALEEEGAEQPPYRESKYSGIGAHISVMDAEEIKDRVLDEKGKSIRYRVTGVFQVDPDRGKMERIWALDVDSPDLEEIRRRYGLSPKLRGHNFHITFAVRNRS